MKILTAFPVNLEDSSGKYIIEGFEELGHQVQNVCERGEHRDNPQKHLLEKLEDFKPDLVFLTRTNIYDTILSTIKAKTRLAAMNVDCGSSVNSWKHLFPLIENCMAYFVVEGGLVPEYRRKFGNKVHFNPTGCSKHHRHYDKSELTPGEIQKYSCDVAFMGARDTFHRGQREPIISAIEKRYGKAFKWWGPESTLGYADTQTHNKICSLAKIVIGNNWNPHIDSYVSERDWRVVGAGGFLLTNLTSNIQCIMKVGVHYALYRTADECLAQIDKYLKEDAERQKISKAAYDYAHSSCRFRNRMKFVCDTVFR